ncbi:MAG: FixH family protein [Alphaproteobacteria bacterium]|nr:FixH family protein [Alphaproteobacteria bacterium]
MRKEEVKSRSESRLRELDMQHLQASEAKRIKTRSAANAAVAEDRDSEGFLGTSKIPYIFIAFFAVVIAVNLVYIYIAKKTWRGVSVEDAYQKGLEYNKTIDQTKQQEKLGWQVNLMQHEEGNKAVRILIEVRDRNSAVIKDAKIYAKFRRPIQEGNDFDMSTDTTDSVGKIDVRFPLPGQWDALITIVHGEDRYYLAKRFVVN